MKRKNITIVWIILFLLLIFGPCLSWSVVSKYVDVSGGENRSLAEKPELSKENIFEYPSLFDGWFSDALPYRNMLIRWNGIIDYYLFGESSSADVTLGQEEWLFLSETLDDYKGTNLYSEGDLAHIANHILETKQYLDENGMEFIIYIAPNKAGIYGNDYLPDYIEKYSETSRTRQLVDYLREHTGVTVIFPKKELTEARLQYPEEQLYFKLDTHWNYLGAYLGTKELLKELDITVPEADALTLEKVKAPLFSWNGYDLANMLGLTGVLKDDVNYEISGYSDAEICFSGDVQNDMEVFYSEVRSFSDSSNDKKLFFCRDSFGAAMVPFLAAEFSEVYSPHSSIMAKEMIEKENADIFVLEVVERSGLDHLLIRNWK